MPPRKKDAGGENGRPTGRLERREGGMVSLADRAAAFQRATQRKGMPLTWGKGDGVRTDPAWKLDEEYRREDGR